MFYGFFFKQKTAYEMRISDWSSDVCSSDLEIAVDLLRLLLAGIGPVVQAARSDAGKDRIELLVADQKGVVLQRDLPIALVEVERGAIVELDHQEGPEADRRRPVQDLGQKAGRLLLVAAPDDGVVQIGRAHV